MVKTKKVIEIAEKKSKKYSANFQEDIKQEILMKIQETRPEDEKTTWGIANHAAYIYMRREMNWRNITSLDLSIDENKEISLADVISDIDFEERQDAREHLMDIPKSIMKIEKG